MTENEKSEFEKQKSNAEKQLNEMYYGAKKGNTERLKIPDFLTVPQEKSNRQNPPENKSIYQKSSNKNSHNTYSNDKKSNSNGFNLLNILNFKNLKMNNDRLIILALCLLIAGEDADELLLLALIYIML